MVSEGGVMRGSEPRLSAPPEAELEAVLPVLVGKLVRKSGSAWGSP